MQIFSTLLQKVCLARKSELDKDLEILLLRRQLAIVDRQHLKRLRISRGDKLIMVILSSQLKAVTGWSMKQLGGVFRIGQPETVFKWHRELVRRKWTFSDIRLVVDRERHKKLNDLLYAWQVKTGVGAMVRSKAN